MPVPPTLARTRRRRGAAWAVTLLLGAGGLLAACAGTPEQDELVESLERAGLPAAQAECAAAALYDNLSDEQIAKIAERGASAVIDGPETDEPIDVARREIAACATTVTTSTTAQGATTLPIEDTTTTVVAGSTTVPPDTEGTGASATTDASATTLVPGTTRPEGPAGTPTTVRPAD